ncbi:hypothetical protein H1P_6590003 [Hyella patelloides LEGE 07179]|uniref:Uncharacterized protein n=1 Tax=Hyella patelloides LEGE 07179 TaxID=945734 RepID=A0A563VRV0_9CYAN|nr:hypothetical protein H1P_2430017 [Hyella patelloides LEGE 07179]VEP17911.1 hypothetical protein H1P_6590003 [Hyella patelloides LEGE 07179]
MRSESFRAFQPRIRAMGLTPISETKLSSGELSILITRAICPPIE